jgi:ribosomal protein L11 methylase PrmA
MPDISKIINGKKVMWDGIVYESEKEAQKVKQTYENDNFEVEMVEEEEKYLLYTRRVVTEIVVEGEPPA